MNILANTRLIISIVAHPHLLTAKTKYLFILSHMRSRSSLLSHVLGSNPDIVGYSELHQNYQNKRDLLKTRVKLYEDGQRSLKGKFLLDKLLHNNLDISTEILEAVRPKIIFLIREPKSTLRSIINMGNITDIEWYKDQAKALNYYCSRLQQLESYSNRIESRGFFIESDDLINSTDTTIKELTEWLNLDTALDKRYQTFNKTGKLGGGDPSQNIAAGVIRKTPEHSEVELKSDILEQGQIAYDKCKKHLMNVMNS